VSSENAVYAYHRPIRICRTPGAWLSGDHRPMSPMYVGGENALLRAWQRKALRDRPSAPFATTRKLHVFHESGRRLIKALHPCAPWGPGQYCNHEADSQIITYYVVLLSWEMTGAAKSQRLRRTVLNL
jgi:hypothetical protein